MNNQEVLDLLYYEQEFKDEVNDNKMDLLLDTVDFLDPRDRILFTLFLQSVCQTKTIEYINLLDWLAIRYAARLLINRKKLEAS